MTAATEKIKAEMGGAISMLKAGCMIGWLVIRHCLSTPRLSRRRDEKLASGLPEGSRRMAKNWIEDLMT